MPRQITESITDTDLGLSGPNVPDLVFRLEDGQITVQGTFIVTRSVDDQYRALLKSSLPALVTAGALTAGERTTLIALLQKARTGLRTAANLAP